MTQQFVEVGNANGLNMIPIISWFHRDALRRQADRLSSLYPAVNTIYIELLSTGVERTNWLFTRFDDIAAELSHLPLRFLLSGIDAGWAIRHAREVLPDAKIHVVTLHPDLHTRFNVGLQDQKARSFRSQCARIEARLRGEDLPPPKPRPEPMPEDVAEDHEEEGDGEDPSA